MSNTEFLYAHTWVNKFCRKGYLGNWSWVGHGYNKHPTFTPLRRGHDARPYTRYNQSPAGVPNARTGLGPTQCRPRWVRCAVAFGGSKRRHRCRCGGDATCGCRWRHLRCGRGLLLSILGLGLGLGFGLAPGRGSSWMSQSSQSDLINNWVGVHEMD